MEEVSACSGNCVINLKQLFDILRDRPSVIRFLVTHGIINDKYCCPKCGSILKLNKNIWQFIFSVENFQTSPIDSTLSGRLSLTSTSQRRAFKGKGIQCGRLKS